MQQHVLAVKANCKVMSGDYVESLATYTEVGHHDQALVHLRVAAHFARVRPASLVRRDFLVTAAALASLRRDSRGAPRSLAAERNSIWTRTQGPWVPSLHVRGRAGRIPTRNELRNCKAQAASLTVDTALAVELGYGWPER
jgi:hypothetical protein